ncbi:Gfo/Idh/MocA family protein [Pedococcus sp. 5OH_020]|uniref:Gfo/Idh/MocA family protein n=1 Tax=Pedococcus sp. 5OH_020 TaxID=2989814 RepID=UPI0022E9EDA7|nr:Gfo/Idh/MocA family oxidoreductase [Pedococcus sp. 5OH_020]
MSKAKTLVVSPSHWHVPLYAEAIAQAHEVIAVSDADEARASSFAEMWEAPLYSSWRAMLDAHGNAELAYVFAPHESMREICLALIEKGIPLVVEKPAGISLQQVVEIKAAAQAAGVGVAVPLVQREGPTDAWLARAGAAVYESVQFIAGPPDRYLRNGSPWMVDPRRAGGGCMINLAPHFVDLFLRSTGATDVTVGAALSSTLHDTAIEDFASLTLSTNDGRVAAIQVGYAFPDSPLKRHCAYMRIGAKGTATVWSDGQASFTSVKGTTETSDLDVDSDPLYAPFVHRVAEELSQGFPGLPGISDLEATMAVIWEAYSLTRKGSHDADTSH